MVKGKDFLPLTDRYEENVLSLMKTVEIHEVLSVLSFLLQMRVYCGKSVCVTLKY